MKKILAILLFLSVAYATTRWYNLDNYRFEDYEREFHKKYTSEERLIRQEIFEQRIAAIKRHNQDSTKTWKEGVNTFTDRSDEELSQYLGLNKQLLYSTKAQNEEMQASASSEQIDLSSLPIFTDWREKGIVSDVKNQGECGSCWTFGTASTVESYWALATGDLQDLSEQQILDCTPNTDDCGGSGGCMGGTPELAYAQIKKLGGIASEWQYAYISGFGEAQQCLLVNQSNNTDIVMAAQLQNFTVLPSNQYAPVMQHLAMNGPLAVNVDASAWFSYESGVFRGCNATNPDIDHVVQLVGYGTDLQFGDYWLVRNSWSPLYGERGYIRIARSSAVPCAVDITPSDGTGCNGGPSQVTVCGECGILYDTSFPNVLVPV